ncbi:MAG: hypothetical protein QXH08_05060 [Candidatus Hadarchaeales archaeon]
MGELRRPYPQSRPSSVEARRETATIRDSGYMVSASPRRTWRRRLGVATVACVASIAVAGAIYAIFLSRRAISPEPATAEPTDEQRLLVSPAEITEEGAIILAEQAENDRRRFKLFSSLTGKGSFFLIDTKEKKISPIEEMDLVLPADQTTRYKIIFLKEDGKVIIWDLGVLPPEELESEGQTKCKEGGGRK